MTSDVVTASVRGARHRRRGEPCEDAAGEVLGGSPPVLVGAVADGHGDPRCTRSDVGARLAVTCACEAAVECSSEVLDPGVLAAGLISRWRAAVDQDATDHPAPADHVPGATTTASRRLLYGTTVVLAVVTPIGVTVLRIGDGEVVGVDASGHARRLLDPEPYSSLGETASLSADDAERAVRSRTVRRVDAPALIVLTTDGVADAYPDEAGLLDACRELHEVWDADGRQRAEDSMRAWLRAAAEYSGDDASAAAIRLWAAP